jgi:hypothetical protein
MAVTTGSGRTLGGVSPVGYWALVAGLVGFGIFDLIAIGLPFLLLGVALAILWPFRDRPWLFWPPLGAIPALVAGYVLVGPVGCSTTAVLSSYGRGIPARTVCTNVLGLDYSGGPHYSPSLVPGLLAGLVVAAMVWALARFAIRRRPARDPAA